MKLKKITKLLALAVVATTSAMFTGCSSDDAPIANYDGNEPMSRSTRAATIIDFEDFDASMMANPTSWGRNYYTTVSGYDKVDMIYNNDGDFSSVINSGVWPAGTSERQSYEFGGIALSNWCLMSNPASNPNSGNPFNADWWYSEYNQMSVYNTAKVGNSNRSGAGANGSNNFAVVYGYDDTYANTTKEASFDLGGVTLKSLKICNTAYTYGVIQNGNKWEGEGGVVVTAKSLRDTHGYLTLIIKCYDGRDNLVKRVETPLADYQNGKNVCITTWTEIPINAANVSKVQFGFFGSDVSTGGLCTPAYVAIDDIVIE